MTRLRHDGLPDGRRFNRGLHKDVPVGTAIDSTRVVIGLGKSRGCRAYFKVECRICGWTGQMQGRTFRRAADGKIKLGCPGCHGRENDVKLSILQVRELGRDIVLRHPEGICGVVISREIVAAQPEMVTEDGKPNGTIRGGVWNLEVHFPDQIAKLAGGKYIPKACDVAAEEERLVLDAYLDAQARIRHRQVQIGDATRIAARAIVPALRRIAAAINAARSESGAAEQCGHIGIDGVARLRLESYLKIKDKALDAADYPLDQLILRTGGERTT